MNILSPVLARAETASWIRCRYPQKPRCHNVTRRLTHTRPLQGPVKKNGRRRPLLAAVTAGTLTAGLFAFGDELHHGYEAATRTGRVVTALAVCMNE